MERERSRIGTVRLRPSNCAPGLGQEDWCPHCGLKHLRAGYCVALDPESIWHTDPEFQRLARLRGATGPVARLAPPVSVASDEVSVADSVTGTLRCEGCGESFEPVRRTAKYCSDACRKKVHRNKEGE